MISLIPTGTSEHISSRIFGLNKVRDELYYLLKAGRINSDAVYKKKHPSTIRLRCASCLKETKVLTDKEPIQILTENKESPAKKVTLDYRMVFDTVICEDCENKLMDRVAAPLVCMACKVRWSWLPLRSYGKFRLERGQTYHSDVCPHCNPERKPAIKEVRNWLAKHHQKELEV